MAYNMTSQQSPDYDWKANSADSDPQVSTSGRVPIIDPEDLQPKNFVFSDESIRKGFIRKVYLILMAQLTITFGAVALFVLNRPVQQFSQNNPGMLIFALIITFALVISMACCEGARRTFPLNFICLAVFTIAESFMVGTLASYYDSVEVLMAVGITAVLCLSLTIFAMQTKYDFTTCGGILLTSLICLIIFGLVSAFWYDHIVRTVYACVGALLACIFLIFDTQLMLGGHHKYSVSPEEYIFAALNLYLDVIRIFMYVLQLLGSRK